jgi:hypothetical protein
LAAILASESETQPQYQQPVNLRKPVDLGGQGTEIDRLAAFLNA